MSSTTSNKYDDLVTISNPELGRKIQMTIHTMPFPTSSYCPKNYWKYIFDGNCIDYILTEDYTNLKKLLQKRPDFVNDCGYCKKNPLSFSGVSMYNLSFYQVSMYDVNVHNNSPLGFVIINGDDRSHIGTLLFDYIAVEKRANLYHVNSEGYNLLELAIIHKKVNYLDSLLKLDSSISKQSKRELTQLESKIYKKQLAFTLNHHMQIRNYETLKYIVENWDQIDLQIEGVTSVKEFINRRYENNNYYSLLHTSIQVNQLTIAKYLLENGADVNSCTENGNTPLHIAAEEKNIKAVKILLLYKADAKAANKSGYDSYMKASSASAEFGVIFSQIVNEGVSLEAINAEINTM